MALDRHLPQPNRRGRGGAGWSARAVAQLAWIARCLCAWLFLVARSLPSYGVARQIAARFCRKLSLSLTGDYSQIVVPGISGKASSSSSSFSSSMGAGAGAAAGVASSEAPSSLAFSQSAVLAVRRLERRFEQLVIIFFYPPYPNSALERRILIRYG